MLSAIASLFAHAPAPRSSSPLSPSRATAKPPYNSDAAVNSRWLVRLIVLLAAACAVVDWSRLLQTGDRGVTTTSNALKVCICFLATLIAYRADPAATDTRLYRLVFALIFAADVCFVTGLEPLGIVLFAVVQGLLTRRNMMGWRVAHLGQHSAGIFGVAATATGLLALTVAGIYWVQGVTPLLIVICLYVSLLAASVTAAWMSRLIGRVRRANADLMTAGMVCFLLCDITVAGNLVLPMSSTAYVVTSSLTWMLYTPALVLIAVSAWPSPTRLLAIA